MRLRNNLSGALAYKSFVPTLVGDYQYIVDELKIQQLTSLFKELNSRLIALPHSDVLELIRMESDDSWRLSTDQCHNPFTFRPMTDNEDVENIVRATVYSKEALEELPISTRLIRNIHI